MDGSSRYDSKDKSKDKDPKKEEHHGKHQDNHKQGSGFNSSMGGRNHHIEAVEEDEEEEYDEENAEEGGHERRRLKELGEDEILEEDEEYDEDEQDQSEQMSIKKKRRRRRGNRGSRTVSISKDSGSLARLSSSRRSGETGGDDQKSSEADESERLDVVEEEVNIGSDRSGRVKRWKPKKDSLTVQELKTVYTKPALKLEKTSEKVSLGDYNFLNMLGQGGFGQVWLVRHKKENPNKNLALKKIMISMNGTLMTE